MRNLALSSITLILLFGSSLAQSTVANIVPKPKEIVPGEGRFTIRRETKIVANGPAAKTAAAFLNSFLKSNFGFKLRVTDKPQTNDFIQFATLIPIDSPDSDLEGYIAQVSPNSIYIAGAEPGLFYGVQSLLQLLPVQKFSEINIPSIAIKDRPRFKYRGMHLDVSRHFQPVSFVKKFIDLMSQYKLNAFHWHLTDDQGWRIEIKKYPKLTEIGSKRSESHDGPYTPAFKGDGVPVEGFYTQDEIRDVVAYAKERHVTVIPEIELPGHASAALTAYPELGKGCAAPDYKFEVKKTWGIFKEVFCPTEETFKFLEDVLDETIKLFPDSPYIHIGGDEVLKDFWKESAYVQELKKRENLKNEHEVQSYFIRRIEDFVNSKGKKIIGWDEILEGGLAPNATVMSWRGIKGGIEAAKSKHDVIMTPTDFLYFDYGQGETKYEPINIGNHVPLKRVYSFEPVPKELTADEAKYIIGAQANLWTEYIKTPAKVEYMVFPRMLALAEVVWTPAEKKDYDDFERRVLSHLHRLDRQNVEYRIPEPKGLRNIVAAVGEDIRVELVPPVQGARILYSTDGSEPETNYVKPIVLKLAENQTLELKTRVVLASGRRSSIYAAAITNIKPTKPVELSEKTAGVKYRFYRGTGGPDGDVTESGESRSIQLPQFSERTAKLSQPFSVVFDGYFYAAEDGIYEFQIEADDAAALTVGGTRMVDALATGSLVTRYGSLPLQKGYHPIQLAYSQIGGDAVLNLRTGIKGTGLRRIYGGELFR